MSNSAYRYVIQRIAENKNKMACILYGRGAKNLMETYKSELAGSLTEVITDEITDELLERKIKALAYLQKSTYDLSNPNDPLIGYSRPFKELIKQIRQVVNFEEPILLCTDDETQAVSIANYIHVLSEKNGKFYVLDNITCNTDIEKAMEECRNGTVHVNNMDDLQSEYRQELLTIANKMGIRLVGRSKHPISDISIIPLYPFTPFVIRVPELKSRQEDTHLLVHYYTLQYNLQAGRNKYLKKVEVENILGNQDPKYLWEIKTLVFNCILTSSKNINSIDYYKYEEIQTLNEYIAKYEAFVIEQVLKRCHGNQSKVARLLGLRTNTLHYKIARYNLQN
jgi:DNA-binding NtrC family response regulator